MQTSVTISTLISTCPAPISTAEGVTNALYWFDLVKAFALNSTDTNLPNRMPLIRDCNYYASEVVINTTEYNPINNNLMHIKSGLQAISTLAGTS